ncbi:MAG: hypothetical protein AAGK78_10360, partial [Planctomycetota bacterium]
GLAAALLTIKPQLGVLLPIAYLAGGYWRAFFYAAFGSIAFAGAATAAGLAAGFWKGLDELRSLRKVDRVFEPAMDAAARQALRSTWSRAVERAKGWTQQGH